MRDLFSIVVLVIFIAISIIGVWTVVSPSNVSGPSQRDVFMLRAENFDETHAGDFSDEGYDTCYDAYNITLQMVCWDKVGDEEYGSDEYWECCHIVLDLFEDCLEEYRNKEVI